MQDSTLPYLIIVILFFTLSLERGRGSLTNGGEKKTNKHEVEMKVWLPAEEFFSVFHADASNSENFL